MTEKQFKELKDDYLTIIEGFVKDNGGLFPHISVFAKIKETVEDDDAKPAFIQIPIPDEFMQNDESKDEFIDNMVPKIFRKVKEKFTPIAVIWASEAWMRKINAPKLPENYRDLPKTEVIIVNIETEDMTNSTIYEMKRLGKQVNSSGDLVDQVELEEISNESKPSMSGRFSGLFKKF